MSQKYIHKNAGYGVFRRAWHRLREPRVISAVYGVMYLVAAVVGVYSVFVPPRAIEASANETLIGLVAATMAIGGAWSFAAVLSGTYWAERPGQWFLLAGLFGYWSTALYLSTFGGTPLWINVFALTAAIGFFAIRFYWTSREPYSGQRFLWWPRRKRRRNNERR